MTKNVAVTGSFASGKSFILNCLENIGYKVFSCDEYVQNIYQNIELQNLIISKISDLNFFDKSNLLKVICENDKSRNVLESIIHPKVREGIRDFEQENQDQKMIFTEVPLLFETNFSKNFISNICVFCSEDIRKKRAQKRGGVSFDIFKKIEQIQLSQNEKKKRADFLIDSSTDENKIKMSLKIIIEKIHEKYI